MSRQKLFFRSFIAPEQKYEETENREGKKVNRNTSWWENRRDERRKWERRGGGGGRKEAGREKVGIKKIRKSEKGEAKASIEKLTINYSISSPPSSNLPRLILYGLNERLIDYFRECKFISIFFSLNNLNFSKCIVSLDFHLNFFFFRY